MPKSQNIYNSVVKTEMEFVNLSLKNQILFAIDLKKSKSDQKIETFFFLDGEDWDLLVKMFCDKKINFGDEISVLATKRKRKGYEKRVISNFLSHQASPQIFLEGLLS